MSVQHGTDKPRINPLSSVGVLLSTGEGRRALGPGYDIFMGLENSEIIWVGCAESLDDAKNKIAALESANPGRYFVRCAATGAIIADLNRSGMDAART